MSTTIQATYVSQLQTVKTDSLALSGNNTTTFAPQDEAVTLNAGTSPAVTKHSVFTQAMTAGAVTINLAALPGENADETVVGTGLKVALWKITNPATNANAITVTKGASSGSTLFGASWTFTLQPGETISGNKDGAAPTIGSGDRNIDVTGTASQTIQAMFVLG